MKIAGCQPDSGNPTVRDERGAYGNVSYGGIRNPLHKLKRCMLPLSPVDALPPGRRFVVIDASSIQAPGATGTDYRLHMAMDLVSLQFLAVLVSDVHTGETRKPCTVAPGDVAVADRGYAQCHGMSAALQQGADLSVRLQPFRVVLGDATGAP